MTEKLSTHVERLSISYDLLVLTAEQAKEDGAERLEIDLSETVSIFGRQIRTFRNSEGSYQRIFEVNDWLGEQTAAFNRIAAQYEIRCDVLTPNNPTLSDEVEDQLRQVAHLNGLLGRSTPQNRLLSKFGG